MLYVKKITRITINQFAGESDACKNGEDHAASQFVVIVFILRVITDYIKLPEALGWIFFLLMLVSLTWLAVSVTKVWWTRKDLIIPFIADFIR